MIDMAEIFNTTELLLKAQEEFADTWLMPTPDDALMFAFSEFGEVTDAQMRLLPKYFRNSDKDLDPNTEICDVLMMLTKFCMNLKPHFSYYSNAVDMYMALNELNNCDYLDFKEYNREDFFKGASWLCDLIGCKGPDYTHNCTIRDACEIYAILYRMLPEGFYFETMKAKMEKYRQKIAKKKADAQKAEIEEPKPMLFSVEKIMPTSPYYNFTVADEAIAKLFIDKMKKFAKVELNYNSNIQGWFAIYATYDINLVMAYIKEYLKKEVYKLGSQDKYSW